MSDERTITHEIDGLEPGTKYQVNLGHSRGQVTVWIEEVGGEDEEDDDEGQYNTFT